MQASKYASLALAPLLTLAGVTASQAVQPIDYFGPNYVFPDRMSEGFLFDTSGGPINPGLIVGFNPQPDPPGMPILDLSNAMAPDIFQPDKQQFKFVISFQNTPGLLLPAVDEVGLGGFAFNYADHSFVVGLTFSGPGGVASWSSFNPQPDPPGDGLGYDVTFAGGDASAGFTISEDGAPLSFALAPEPSTWAMMGIGFAALGFAGWRASRKNPAAPI